MRKGLEYLHTENRRIKDKRVRLLRDHKSQFLARVALLTHAWNGKKTKEWDGRERIVTLTGWTHPLHTNTKRKCVSILCVAEISE